jgi:hypothetical protein
LSYLDVCICSVRRNEENEEIEGTETIDGNDSSSDDELF